jgi:ABC-type transporter MlaC component
MNKSEKSEKKTTTEVKEAKDDVLLSPKTKLLKRIERMGKEATKIMNGPKPKKAMSAYVLFFNDARKKLLAKGITGPEAAAESGKLWKILSEKEKDKFQAVFLKDKERYDQEMKDFKEKGFFINENKEKVENRRYVPPVKKSASKEKPKKKDASAKNNVASAKIKGA